jgi:hypothetical protein
VSEQLLDDPEVGATLEKVRRERVAERVRRDADGQARPLAEEIEAVPKPTDPERLSPMVQEDLDRIDNIRAVPGAATEQGGASILEVSGERGSGGPAEEADPLLSPLAEDAQLAAAEVEGAEVGSGELADPETGRVCGLDDRPVADRERDRQVAAAIAAFGVGMFTYDAFAFTQAIIVLFMLLGIGGAALRLRTVV